MEFRLADPSDADAIAALHADSWRRHYRGAYADEFLDGDVVADRRAVWAARFAAITAGAGPECHTLLAIDDGVLIGFAHTIFDRDPTWGALLDNLHVVADRRRSGIGSSLVQSARSAAAEHGTGLHLWVLEQNTAARAFYAACGGECVERAPVPPPGGVPERLVGTPWGLRIAWPRAR